MRGKERGRGERGKAWKREGGKEDSAKREKGRTVIDAEKLESEKKKVK